MHLRPVAVALRFRSSGGNLRATNWREHGSIIVNRRIALTVRWGEAINYAEPEYRCH